MIHTNRCKHCGKTKEEHTGHLWMGTDYANYLCKGGGSKFLDSGLAALDAHKEELYEAVLDFMGKNSWNDAKPYKKIQSILNQIEKEK